MPYYFCDNVAGIENGNDSLAFCRTDILILVLPYEPKKKLLWDHCQPVGYSVTE